MSTDNLIPADTFCACHHIELSFVQTLHESGLIGMTTEEGAPFLAAGELPDLEKFIRWHYELAINTEGIEAVAHLLSRISHLQEENRILRNRLRGYQSGDQAALIEE